jgi:hypothetical protein
VAGDVHCSHDGCEGSELTEGSNLANTMQIVRSTGRTWILEPWLSRPSPHVPDSAEGRPQPGAKKGFQEEAHTGCS